MIGEHERQVICAFGKRGRTEDECVAGDRPRDCVSIDRDALQIIGVDRAANRRLCAADRGAVGRIERRDMRRNGVDRKLHALFIRRVARAVTRGGAQNVDAVSGDRGSDDIRLIVDLHIDGRCCVGVNSANEERQRPIEGAASKRRAT